MSYKLKYTVPFKTINNISMLVEILLEGYTGEAMELVGAESPFNVSTDDEDFLYTPYRFSSATLSLVGGDYMQELYSTGYQQYKVNLKREGIIIWTGFISPEMYTQDYANQTFEIDIECVSAMSVLEYIDYKKVGNKITFVTIQSLIQKCVEESKGDYTSVYIPRVYSTEANMASDALRLMEISEQNFFDEDDKAMNLKEVLEEVCKFLNWTCVDWSGDLYFVDIDHQGEYFQCAKDFLSGSNVNAINSLTVQNLGFAGSGHTFDILGGYNKVTVKDSNYCINQIFPEEDFDKLEAFCDSPTINEKHKIQEKKYFTSDIFKLQHFIAPSGMVSQIPVDEADLAEYKSHPLDLLGIMPIWRCTYNERHVNGQWIPDINEYNWEKIYQCTNKNILPLKKLLQFKKPLMVLALTKGMAISISCSIQYCKRFDMVEWGNKEKGFEDGEIYIPCRISIGSWWFDGRTKTWVFGEPKYFDLTFNSNSFYSGSWVECDCNKTLQQKYDGLKGYLIIMDSFLRGELLFEMHTPMDTHQIEKPGYFIKDIKMSISQPDDLNSKSSDRTYQNVITEKYINPLDDIEFKISSYNDDGLCHSKVILGNQYLTNNLYSAIYSRKIRPEEQLIQR
ncbi:MAG: hypothetical protein RR220_08750, partial [Bacteroidaceae bacterium]